MAHNDLPQSSSNAKIVVPRGGNFSTFDVDLWVYHLQTSFQLSGRYAQSRLTKEYYPHSFTQPILAVSCQTQDWKHYENTIVGLRKAQNRSLQNSAEAEPETQLAHLIINGSSDAFRAHNTTAGKHKITSCYGWIDKITRGARRHTVAPEIKFNFVIAKMVGGLYEDQTATVAQTLSFVDFIEQGIRAGDFITAADIERATVNGGRSGSGNSRRRGSRGGIPFITGPLTGEAQETTSGE